MDFPEKIVAGTEEVSYVYSATGQKLATKAGNSTTYYRGSFIYNNDELDHLLQPEGIIRKTTGAYVYYYAKKDHLGSTRVLCHEANGKMIADQTTDYYPFGLSFRNYGMNFNRYLFSGKELQNQVVNGKALQLYDFGARNYDPVLGRWFNIDPHADKYYSYSPYTYCLNSPIKFIDPTGEFPIETLWDISNVLYDIGAAVINHIKGDYEAAESNWVDLGLDAGAVLIPYFPAGASKIVKGGQAGFKALDKANDAGKAARMTENAAKGRAFEKQVGESLGKNKASQVTIEVADGTRTRVDFVQKNNGKVTLVEAKGSQTASLTVNQKKAHPQIELSGGIVRGNNGTKVGLPNGEKILPTKVKIIRPKDLRKPNTCQ